ncbi:TPA: hypothetical protein QDB09_003272 [Burkholderia vietnamiensis]|nr:hypothetical protein [Burkholderia vietnamiensis]
MKRAWEVTQLAFVWLLIAIGFLAVYRVWTIVALAVGSTKDFWDIAAAIGTCGAVIVALHIASADTRRKQRDELAAARVSASGMYARIGVVHGMLHSIQRNISEALANGCGPATIPAIGVVLAEIPAIEIDELAPLIPLGNHCAENFTAALDRIRIAKQVIATEGEKPKPTKESRQECLEFVNSLLLEAFNMIDRGSETIGECSHAFRKSYALATKP